MGNTRAQLVISSIGNVCDLADEFVNRGNDGRHKACYINDYGELVSKVNTACSCHPAYEIEPVDLEEFYKWLGQRNKL